jgi:Ca2+-binding EF-hand superfamily protein
LSAFAYFDKDASGYITIDEISQACKDFGLDDIHIDEMIKEIDQDNVSIFSWSFYYTFLLLKYLIY